MKKNLIILLVALAFFAGMNIGGYFYQLSTASYVMNSTYNSVSTEGLVPVEPQINSSTVYLVGDCKIVSFDVTPDQAYSILKGMEKSIGARPLTHDIMKDVFDVFNINVLQIRIDRYDSDIYYATIILRQNNKVLELDARPSDAIALAVRLRMKLYFKQSILEANGVNVC